MNCQTVLSELCVTLFSSFGKSIRIDMNETFMKKRFFCFFSYCLS